MNFLFISPHFPANYYLFCKELKKNGVNVLGIGDAPYATLREELKDSLTEYYRVNDMENYDDMYRAVAYLIFKHGKIDYLESNNEYWLAQDAQLRTDFNIRTGLFEKNVKAVKFKSEMKKYYAKAGVQTARWKLVDNYDSCKEFVKEVGWPLIIKPNSGVGAADTHKIANSKQLKVCIQQLDNPHDYIMEEFIDGSLVSYDGIAGKNRQIIYETSHIYPEAVMDLLHNQDDVCFWSCKKIDPKLQVIGRKVISTFPSNARCFHTEYFILNKDKPGLGKKGDYIGLEINMRPPGGCIPDMINYANDLSYYKIYADMICGKEEKLLFKERKYCCAFAGRRDQYEYFHTKDEIRTKYKDHIMEELRLPDIMAEAMGNQAILARFDSVLKARKFCDYVIRKKGE